MSVVKRSHWRRHTSRLAPTHRPQATKAEEWDEEIPSENTAPPPRVTPSVESWGVTVEEARALLKRQMCPVCGSGPWKSPLNHVARKHAIDRLTMRDICGLGVRDKVTDPEVRAAWIENGRNKTELLAANALNWDRRTARRTRRAKEASGQALRDYEAANPEAMAAMRAGFRDRMTTPEALAKWKASMERVRADRVYTSEERQAFAERMASEEVKAKRAKAQRKHDQCTVGDCGKPHVARGYCKGHWNHWRQYGDPLASGEVGGHNRALSDEQERQAMAMLASGKSQSAVAEQFGCSQTSVSRLVRRWSSREDA